MTRDTSRESYREIENNGLLSERRWAVYKWLYHHGPATQSECHKAGFPELQMDSVKPRFAELEMRGVIKVVGERDCQVTGRNVLLWDVTSALPKEIKAGTWVLVGEFKSWLAMLREIEEREIPVRKMSHDIRIATHRKGAERFWKIHVRECKKEST